MPTVAEANQLLEQLSAAIGQPLEYSRILAKVLTELIYTAPAKYYTLTAADITAKGFQLTLVPLVPSGVAIVPVGGTICALGVDFVITDEGFVSWDGLAFEPQATEGQVLVMIY